METYSLFRRQINQIGTISESIQAQVYLFSLRNDTISNIVHVVHSSLSLMAGLSWSRTVLVRPRTPSSQTSSSVSVLARSRPVLPPAASVLPSTTLSSALSAFDCVSMFAIVGSNACRISFLAGRSSPASLRTRVRRASPLVARLPLSSRSKQKSAVWANVLMHDCCCSYTREKQLDRLYT